MKTKLFFISLVFYIAGLTNIKAQGFQPPAPGKAVVYIVRVTAWGKSKAFKYFHQDKYIGVFKGVNYLRYECDPGPNLFWASSEHMEFITTDLKAGGTYVILVDVWFKKYKAHVGLRPVTTSAEYRDVLERVKNVVNSRKAIVTPLKNIDATNVKLEKFIDEQLNRYETEWKGTKNFKNITPDMAIPEEAMK